MSSDLTKWFFIINDLNSIAKHMKIWKQRASHTCGSTLTNILCIIYEWKIKTWSTQVYLEARNNPKTPTQIYSKITCERIRNSREKCRWHLKSSHYRKRGMSIPRFHLVIKLQHFKYDICNYLKTDVCQYL
jgi:hypothetical protein